MSRTIINHDVISLAAWLKLFEVMHKINGPSRVTETTHDVRDVA